MCSWHAYLVRFEGAPDDPLLRGGVAKGEEAPAVSAKTTGAGAPVEGTVEKDHGEYAETAPETEETTRPKKEHVESVENTLTNQVNIQTLLGCSRRCMLWRYISHVSCECSELAFPP